MNKLRMNDIAKSIREGQTPQNVRAIARRLSAQYNETVSPEAVKLAIEEHLQSGGDLIVSLGEDVYAIPELID